MKLEAGNGVTLLGGFDLRFDWFLIILAEESFPVIVF